MCRRHQCVGLGITRKFTPFLFALAVAASAFVTNSNHSLGSSTQLPYRSIKRTDSGIHPESRHREEERSFSGFQLHAHKYKYVQVTLERDTPNVGKKGEIVHVNRNFAFNYLVPFGFARYTTRSELVGLALDRDYKEALVNIRKTAALQLKNKLGKGLVLEFEVPASDRNPEELNSPLRAIHIIQRLRDLRYLSALDMLREQDVKIHTDSGFILKFGTYNVTLHLDEEIESSLKVRVTDIPVSALVLKDKTI